jgi:hypothetical protein
VFDFWGNRTRRTAPCPRTAWSPTATTWPPPPAQALLAIYPPSVAIPVATTTALIALHDVGKFSRTFQVQAPELWPLSLGPFEPPPAVFHVRFAMGDRLDVEQEVLREPIEDSPPTWLGDARPRFVYDNPPILRRSARALLGAEQITTPDNIRGLVEAAYDSANTAVVLVPATQRLEGREVMRHSWRRHERD